MYRTKLVYYNVAFQSNNNDANFYQPKVPENTKYKVKYIYIMLWPLLIHVFVDVVKTTTNNFQMISYDRYDGIKYDEQAKTVTQTCN